MRSSPMLLLLVLVLGNASWADAPVTGDPRVALGLTETEKVEFLSEMRTMLASIQGIIAGIGVEDREGIAAAAQMSGNRMARATPESVRAKLPRTFQELGGPTHLLFEEIVVRAETDDMADLAVLTGETLEQCVACHALFRAD